MQYMSSYTSKVSIEMIVKTSHSTQYSDTFKPRKLEKKVITKCSYVKFYISIKIKW